MRDAPQPPPLDTPEEARQLDRYYMLGLLCMAVLIVAFPLYKLGEPERRARTTAQMQEENVAQGQAMFTQHCAACHGDQARGGRGFPTLSAKEFLASVSDTQLRWLISGGVPGSAMTAYGLDLGGPFTDQEITWLVAYLRSLEEGAPSVPDWYKGLTIAPLRTPLRTPPADALAKADAPSAESSPEAEQAAGGDSVPPVASPVVAGTAVVLDAPARAAPAVEELFATRCAMCHGPAGEGTPIAPAVRPLRAALAADRDSAFHLISDGVPGTAMMAFGVDHGGTLDGTAIRALVQWLREGR